MTTDQATGEPGSDFFLEVEAHFASRRGTPFIFSAKDWALLKGWHSDGIPLPVVLEAIDRCFDKREEAGRKRTISSLSYCRHAVRELWDERKDLAVGGEGELPESDPGERLQTLSQQVLEAAETAPDAAATLLRAAAVRIAAASSERTVPSIEERLMGIESELLGQMEQALDASEREAINAEVDALLSAYAALKPDAHQKTREANLKRLLRRRIGLPRLSLFS